MSNVTRNRAVGLAFVAALALAGAGCTVVYHGPPTHPEPGYVYHYAGGIDLVYRSGIDLYVVSGMPNVYFYGGRFFRRERRHWLVTHHPRGGRWSRADRRSVPPPLRRTRRFKQEHRETRRDRSRRH